MRDKPRAIIYCIVFCLAISIVAAYNARNNYLREKENVEQRVFDTSYLIAEWIKGSFEVSDYVLRDIVSTVDVAELTYPSTNPVAHARRSALLDDKRKTLHNVFMAALFNRDCVVTHNPAFPGNLGFDASQREYCLLLKNDPRRQSGSSNSYLNNFGRLNVTQVRRIPSATQTFVGFAALAINLNFFSKWLEEFSPRQDSVIAILDLNQNLLARKPALPEALGKRSSDRLIESFLASGESYMSTSYRSPIDDEPRQYNFRKLDDLPFIVIVGEADYEWQRGWRQSLAVTLIALLLINGLAIMTLRHHFSLLRQRKALEQANQKLAALSVTDGLTGIANRLYFDAQLSKEWSRASRIGHPLAVMMIDVDLFKSYNDHYGHPAGDAALKSVAAILGECARRAGDLAARYGGEEFVVIAANTDIDSAHHIAETIRCEIESMTIAHEKSPVGKLTVSIGVAVMAPGMPVSAEELLSMADEALYRAKETGRNRTVLFTPPP
jgi:diguanylate cyclase (GGDEF)-like protein